jgi:DNA-binding transcriptional MocR family regulator
MSVYIWSRVWLVQLPANEKLVFLALANFCDAQGGNCYPSIATLRRFTGLSEREIQRCIRTLEAGGYLTVQPRSGTSNVYKLHPRLEVTPVQQPPVTAEQQTPASQSPDPRQGVRESTHKPLNRPDLTVEQKIDLLERTGRKAQAQELREATEAALKEGGASLH